MFSGSRVRVKLISGRVSGLEPDLDPDSPTLLLRGYDDSQRLYQAAHRRSFAGMTDGDIARKLAIESGLRIGTIDAAPEVHEYVFQNNQTNAEFLYERARRSGVELFVDDGVLHFRKPTRTGSPARLTWGESLREFRPRVSSAGRIDEVEVRDWDPRSKSEIVGRARQPRDSAGPAVLCSGTMTVVDQSVATAAEADRIARAVLDEASAAVVESEGVCDADPSLGPGRQILVRGVGKRFEGPYYLTRVTHEWTRDRPMVTRFVGNSRRQPDLWGLLDSGRQPSGGMNLVIGLVTDNRDPENFGRVKVRFPWLCDQSESAWARLASPMAGSRRGLFALPEIDDEVLLGFEHGDVHRPFVLGALWNGSDPPPASARDTVGRDGRVVKRVLRSRSGLQMVLDDSEGGESITVADASGRNTMVLHARDGVLRIELQGEISVKAGAIKLSAAHVIVNGQQFPPVPAAPDSGSRGLESSGGSSKQP